MSFRRPSMRKINKKIPKPKKSLRKLKRKSIKPSRVSKRSPSTKPSNSKKKKTTRMGICYAGSNCTGKRLLGNCTKSKCKNSGGKSWRGSLGCEKI